MPTTKGRLRPRDEQKIQRNFVDLTKDIDAKEVTPALYEKGVITKFEMEDIMNEIPGKLKRNTHLVNLILDSGPGNSFKIFLEVLKEKYGHIVDLLEKKEYVWFEEIEEPIKQHVITMMDAERIALLFTDDWEIIMVSLGLTKADIDNCKARHSEVNGAKVELLQSWASPGNHTVEDLMTCLIQVVDNSAECPNINWEGLKECIKATDPDEMDLL